MIPDPFLNFPIFTLVLFLVFAIPLSIAMTIFNQIPPLGILKDPSGTFLGISEFFINIVLIFLISIAWQSLESRFPFGSSTSGILSAIGFINFYILWQMVRGRKVFGINVLERARHFINS